MCKPKRNGGLGFKNISIFNQALLAKQAWRLLQNPHSLASQVLKAKYYQNKEFLQAKLGRSSSYVWCSILYGQELLQKGLRWRIGDGSTIRIFHDPWLPSPSSSFKVFTPLQFMTDHLRVSD